MVAPANDLIVNAQTIVSGSTYTGSTVEATAEPGENHYTLDAPSSTAKSVWFKFDLDNDAIVHLDTKGSDFDTVLKLYYAEGNPSPQGPADLSLWGTWDDRDTPPYDNTSEIAGAQLCFDLGPWYVQLEGPDTYSGNYQLLFELTPIAPPPNATPATATVVTEAGGTYSGTNWGGNNSGFGFHWGDGIGAGVWFKLDHQHGGTLTVETLGSDYDTDTHVYSCSVGEDVTTSPSTVLIYSNDSGSWYDSRTDYTSRAEVGGIRPDLDYYILIDGYAYQRGNWQAAISFTPLYVGSAAAPIVTSGVATGDSPARVYTASGSLKALVEEEKNRAAGDASELYVVPTAADESGMAAVWSSILSGDTPGAAGAAEQYGYEVYDYTDTDTGRSSWVLRENVRRARNWGTYILNRAANARDEVIGVPHMLFDTNTETQGIRVYEDRGSRMFALAGAHRNANAATDADGYRVADVANYTGANVFQSIIEASGLTASSVIIEPHAFGSTTVPPYGSAHMRAGSPVEVVIDPPATSGFVPKPANLQVGDLMLTFAVVDEPADTLIAPSGWTAVAPEVNDVRKVALLSKVADEADVAGTGWTWSWQTINKGLLGFVHYENAAGIEVAASTSEPGSSVTTHSTPSITTTTPDDILVAFFAVSNATSWKYSGATGTPHRAATWHTSASYSSSAAIYDNDNFTSPPGTYQATAINSTASSGAGFFIVAIKPAGPVVDVDAVISDGIADSPASPTSVGWAERFRSKGYTAIANDGSWPLTATPNRQGRYINSLGGVFVSAEQAYSLRTSDIDNAVAALDMLTPSAHIGLATASHSYHGTATGASAHAGSAQGLLLDAGSPTGSTSHAGAATAALAESGTGHGTRTSAGSSGAFEVVHGQASGKRDARAIAAGDQLTAGSAAGHRSADGTASGPQVVHGSAIGFVSHAGAATGALAGSGVASGRVSHAGSATASTRLSGTVSGRAIHLATGVGGLVVHGSSTGAIEHRGSVTASLTEHAVTEGHAAHRASASGATTLAGSPSGELHPVGSATAPLSSSGAGQGYRTASGLATGRQVIRAKRVMGGTDAGGYADGFLTASGVASGATAHRGGSSGSLSHTASATGASEHTGSTAGGTHVQGVATGTAPVVAAALGSASGTVLVAAIPAGQTEHRAAGSGTASLTGNAGGRAQHEAGSVASIVTTISASGHVQHRASASGAVVITGTQATGARASLSRATGQVVATGSAAGARVALGSASGSDLLTILAHGSVEHDASASGSLTVSGTSFGVHPLRGQASGSLTLTPGLVTGVAVSVDLRLDPHGVRLAIKANGYRAKLAFNDVDGTLIKKNEAYARIDKNNASARIEEG